MQFPPTSAKVILNTTHGELDVELWCKEIPKGCRNFIQLCLEGYYDNCKFHRLIPNFMIQGGDASGTGEGGKSIYGGPFTDEFNNKITFSTRGMLAYSSSGPNTNESQFFITFDACHWLDKKHTIFGRVVGDTIFNLMAMNSVDTDTNDQPLIPVYIKTANVIINPMSITMPQKPTIAPEPMIPQKGIIRKSRNTSLLSFEDEDDNDCQHEQKQIVNSHDMLNDPKLKKEVVISKEELEMKKQKKNEENKKKQDLIDAVNEPKQGDVIQKKIKLSQKQYEFIQMELNEEDRKLLSCRVHKNEKGEYEIQDEAEVQSNHSDQESEIEDEEMRELRYKQKEEYDKLRADVLQFKTYKFGSNNPMIRERQEQEKQLLTNVEARRAKFIQELSNKKHDEEYEQKIQRLQEKLVSDQVKSDKYHWLNHKLKFHVDSANAFSVASDKEKVQDYTARAIMPEQEQQFVRNNQEKFNEPMSNPEQKTSQSAIDKVDFQNKFCLKY